MKIRLLLLSVVCLSFFSAILAGTPSYIKTKDGVIVFTDSSYTGTTHAVKLEVVSDHIIRVIVSPKKEILTSQSLVTAYSKSPDLSWEIVSGKETLTLKTKSISAVVNLKNGAVYFYDRKGNIIVHEKSLFGRSFQPAIFDGQPFYGITQTFQVSSDEGLYGLGQHQDGIMNYKGKQVTFFQNNTEVAVPF
ncbi:MAG TPA: hypothetical protein VL946_05590, partial [Lacibacter sp.]|nr:hypothetical protein [Lacibacter sp.]